MWSILTHWEHWGKLLIMALRKTVLAEGEVYHILNRGVDKRVIFSDTWGYKRFIQAMIYYQIKNPPVKFSKFILNKDRYKIEKDKKLVEIFAYCLMPTHFHFILKQLSKDGISLFIKKLLDSYARYFNTKYSRRGPLFEGNFKAIRAENDEQLIHLSRYIHLNPITDFLVRDLKDYLYSSYSEYLGFSKTKIADKEFILSHFSSPKKYEDFVLSRVYYQRELKKIQRLLLE